MLDPKEPFISAQRCNTVATERFAAGADISQSISIGLWSWRECACVRACAWYTCGCVRARVVYVWVRACVRVRVCMFVRSCERVPDNDQTAAAAAAAAAAALDFLHHSQQYI